MRVSHAIVNAKKEVLRHASMPDTSFCIIMLLCSIILLFDYPLWRELLEAASDLEIGHALVVP